MGEPTSADPTDTPWWQGLGNPELDALMQRALAGNFDVIASRERIAQALAVQARARAGLWPALEGDLGVERESMPAVATVSAYDAKQVRASNGNLIYSAV